LRKSIWIIFEKAARLGALTWKMIDASVAELIDERDAVRSLGLV
jgi:hypothetical protein